MKSPIAAVFAVAALPLLVESHPFSPRKPAQLERRVQHPHPIAPHNLPLKAVRRSRTSPLRPRGSVAGGVTALLDPDHELDYTVEVSFAGQSIDLLIDTGSSKTWAIVDGYSCESGYKCNYGSPISLNSDITIYENASFSVKYADGSGASGPFASTTVEVAGITVDGLEVGLVETLASNGDGEQSGLIGLGLPYLATAENNGETFFYPPVMEKIFNDGLADPFFSLAISRDESQNGDGGYLAIGGIPSLSDSRINASSTYGTSKMLYDTSYSSSSLTYYIAAVDSIQWLDKSTNTIIKDTTPEAYVVDSGTTLSKLPDTAAAAINALFDPPATLNNNMYMVDCDATTTDVAITIGGVTLPINPKDLIWDSGDGCASGIQPQGDGQLFIADTFLKSMLVGFDWKNEVLDFYSRPYYES